MTHASNEPQDTLDIYGTLGSIHVAMLNGGEVRVRVGALDRIESLPPAANIHAPLIAEFMEAVAGLGVRRRSLGRWGGLWLAWKSGFYASH